LVLYMPATTWLENLALARSSGTYLRYRDKLARRPICSYWMISTYESCPLLKRRICARSSGNTHRHVDDVYYTDHCLVVSADPVSPIPFVIASSTPPWRAVISAASLTRATAS
jgi:hypothetical protein